MRQPRILSCCAVGTADSWEAICLDFDITVQGHSFREVQDKLGEAIESYVHYVATLPEQEQKRLLARRAPWHVRAKFIAGTIFTLLFLRSDHSKRHNFSIPCTV
jgi:hypothetical protein